MAEITLKPCPFCGYASPKMTEKRSGSYRRTGDMFQVLCGKCKARGPIFTGKYLESGEFGRLKYTPDSAAIAEAKQKAVDAWNWRANEDTVLRHMAIVLEWPEEQEGE